VDEPIGFDKIAGSDFGRRGGVGPKGGGQGMAAAIPSSPPLQNRTANAGRSRLYAGSGDECLKQVVLRADDANLAICQHCDRALDEGMSQF